MSKNAPHNATIEFIQQGRQQIVRKQYRTGAKYTAKQEVESYKQLSELLAQTHEIRAAKLLRFDERDNALYMEALPGADLYERVLNGDTEILNTIRESLLELFWKARQHQFSFDSDPSNIMFTCDEIVLIDPICTKLEIRDYSFIVFMWGLIKMMLRNKKFWRGKRIMSHWKTYYRKYCQHEGINHKMLNIQMVNYINLVIRWNCEHNQVEGLFTRIFRRVVVVPIYMAVRTLFHYDLVH